MNWNFGRLTLAFGDGQIVAMGPDVTAPAKAPDVSTPDATLLVADGDILETPTQVEKAYIQGRTVDLSSRHTRLWKKYLEKYRRQAD